MNSHRPEEAIVDAALERPRIERAQYLEEACGSDARLRQLAQALLCAHEHALGPRNPRNRSSASQVVLDKPSEKIGSFQNIGEDGPAAPKPGQPGQLLADEP